MSVRALLHACTLLLPACLQLSEEALLQLAELGYNPKAASRALRFTGGDVAAAVDFLSAQQDKAQVCGFVCVCCTI